MFKLPGCKICDIQNNVENLEHYCHAVTFSLLKLNTSCVLKWRYTLVKFNIIIKQKTYFNLLCIFIVSIRHFVSMKF